MALMENVSLCGTILWLIFVWFDILRSICLWWRKIYWKQSSMTLKAWEMRQIWPKMSFLVFIWSGDKYLQNLELVIEVKFKNFKFCVYITKYSVFFGYLSLISYFRKCIQSFLNDWVNKVNYAKNKIFDKMIFFWIGVQ